MAMADGQKNSMQLQQLQQIRFQISAEQLVNESDDFVCALALHWTRTSRLKCTLASHVFSCMIPAKKVVGHGAV